MMSLNFWGSFLFMDLPRFLIIQHVDIIKLTIYMTSCWNLQDGMYAKYIAQSFVISFVTGGRNAMRCLTIYF